MNETSGAAAEQLTEKIYMENTLLRIAGALFCHDPKRAGSQTGEIALKPGIAEKQIVIRPDLELGQPGPLAHKIFVALMRKHSDYGRPVQGDISFTRRELTRLIGRQSWGGRDGEQLTRALMQIQRTFVGTAFKTREGRFAEHSFAIFPEVYLERAERESDPIETCVVTLARPIIASLQDDHFTCLNHALMRELGTIGQAVMMRLFFHFSNLYDGHHKAKLVFPKRYEAICREWLGGLTVLKHRSKIETEQLGPHLRQLIKVGFLSSYAISPARSGEGFVITFRPGATFFADYDRFYRSRRQGGLQFRFHDDRQQAEPVKVAYLFQERRSGQKLAGIPYVSSREVESAKALLADIPLEGISAFLDYALREAERTNFRVQSLGGVRQYVAPYLQERQRRQASDAAAAAQASKAEQDALQDAFARFRHEEIQAVFASLSSAERITIEALAQQAGATGFASGSKLVVDRARDRIVAERHSDRLTSFESWRVQVGQAV